MAADVQDAPRQVAENIATIARLEQEAVEQRSLSDRLGIAVARFFGSLMFIALHGLWFGVWIVLNHPNSPYRFDPYPYSLLMLLLAIEVILLTTFVLISQKQMTRIADRRAHLTLQIDLLAEMEMTKVLKTLQAITEHLEMKDWDKDGELSDLAQPTEVETVVRALEQQLPDPSAPKAANVHKDSRKS